MNFGRRLLNARSKLLGVHAFRAALLLVGLCPTSAAAPEPSTVRQKLLVISVDGLDWRYLRDRDRLGLKIPVIRQLMAQSRVVDDVVGVWPTVTWPSHTSILTGTRPDQHGILSNRRTAADGGDYYWSPELLHGEPLWACAARHGLTTAAVTWPVTRTDAITWNLPEYFARRNGGSMDLATIASAATPGLVVEITAAFPSFAQQWMDDRTRTQAVIYLLRAKRPDLLLVHLVDLDSEAHDQGPFDTNANAILERTDELIGQMLAAAPADYQIALTSDHGFERIDRIVNVAALLTSHGLSGKVAGMGGLAVATDKSGAESLRQLAADPASGVGREVPRAELDRYAPRLITNAAFEPVAHVMFGRGTDPLKSSEKPAERGEHGFWPARADYRSVFMLRVIGAQQPQVRGEADMLQLRGELARALQLPECVDPR